MIFIVSLSPLLIDGTLIDSPRLHDCCIMDRDKRSALNKSFLCSSIILLLSRSLCHSLSFCCLSLSFSFSLSLSLSHFPLFSVPLRVSLCIAFCIPVSSYLSPARSLPDSPSLTCFSASHSLSSSLSFLSLSLSLSPSLCLFIFVCPQNLLLFLSCTQFGDTVFQTGCQFWTRLARFIMSKYKNKLQNKNRRS